MCVHLQNNNNEFSQTNYQPMNHFDMLVFVPHSVIVVGLSFLVQCFQALNLLLLVRTVPNPCFYQLPISLNLGFLAFLRYSNGDRSKFWKNIDLGPFLFFSGCSSG